MEKIKFDPDLAFSKKGVIVKESGFPIPYSVECVAYTDDGFRYEITIANGKPFMFDMPHGLLNDDHIERIVLYRTLAGTGVAEKKSYWAKKARGIGMTNIGASLYTQALNRPSATDMSEMVYDASNGYSMLSYFADYIARAVPGGGTNVYGAEWNGELAPEPEPTPARAGERPIFSSNYLQNFLNQHSQQLTQAELSVIVYAITYGQRIDEAMSVCRHAQTRIAEENARQINAERRELTMLNVYGNGSVVMDEHGTYWVIDRFLHSNNEAGQMSYTYLVTRPTRATRI